jgi:arylformamidase
MTEKRKFYDLSAPLYNNMPLFPGNIPLNISKIAIPEKDGYGMESYSSSTHCGTHIDAQSHFINNGQTVDKIPLDILINRGYVVRPKIYGLEISMDAMKEAWKDRYEGKTILINTGWSEKRSYSKEFQEQFPGLSTEAARFIVEKKVKLIGIDTLGIDPYTRNDFPSHKLLLKGGCSIIEDLANLNSLSPNIEYTIMALPLNLLNCSGSMARVVAME